MNHGLSVLYGAAPAVAYWSHNRTRLMVTLTRDPGTGPMTFGNIAPSCVTFVSGSDDDRARMVELLTESLRYVTPDQSGAHALQSKIDALVSR